MKHAVWSIFATIAVTALSAQASPITIDGLEWRQVTETTNVTWMEIATVCDSSTGACSGSLDEIEFSGWVWASVTEIGDMFRSVTGYPVSDPGTVSHGGSPWAPRFFELFDPTYSSPAMVTVNGLSRDANEYSAARPYVVDRLDGGSDWISTGVRATMHDPYPEVGGWFYRSADAATVSEPGPLSLLVLGAALMLCARSAKRRRTDRAEF